MKRLKPGENLFAKQPPPEPVLESALERGAGSNWERMMDKFRGHGGAVELQEFNKPVAPRADPEDVYGGPETPGPTLGELETRSYNQWERASPRA